MDLSVSTEEDKVELNRLTNLIHKEIKEFLLHNFKDDVQKAIGSEALIILIIHPSKGGIELYMKLSLFELIMSESSR